MLNSCACWSQSKFVDALRFANLPIHTTLSTDLGLPIGSERQRLQEIHSDKTMIWENHYHTTFQLPNEPSEKVAIQTSIHLSQNYTIHFLTSPTYDGDKKEKEREKRNSLFVFVDRLLCGDNMKHHKHSKQEFTVQKLDIATQTHTHTNTVTVYTLTV